MAEQLYLLTKDDVEKLRGVIRMVSTYGLQALVPQRQLRFPIYRKCSGLLSGALNSTDGSGTVDNVKMIHGVCPTTSSAGTVTVYNSAGFSGADNAKCSFEWSYGSTRGSTDSNGAWEFLNSGSVQTSTSLTFVTANQWNSTAHKLQKKTRTAKVISPSTESGWTDIDTASCAQACT